jgi:hypothetical protein
MPGCCHHDIKHYKILDSFQPSQDNDKIKIFGTELDILIPNNIYLQSFLFEKHLSFSDPPPLTFTLEDYYLQVFKN